MASDDTSHQTLRPKPSLLHALKERLTGYQGEPLPELMAETLRPSAVLVPIYPTSTGPVVLMTERTQHLAHHKGQISFPGGALEENETLLECALRETEEELSLNVASEQILGSLDETPVISRFRIQPFVALLEKRPQTKANADEVAEVLEFPLKDFLHPQNHRMEIHSFQEMDVPVHFFQSCGKIVWGASARIIANLLLVAFDYRPPQVEEFLKTQKETSLIHY